MSIDLSKFWLGLDMPTLPSYTDTAYPRYNLITGQNGYRIEIAVPGWKKEELEIVFDNKELQIKGKKEHKLGDDEESLKKSITKFRQDEIDHKNLAYNEGATKKGLYFVLDKIIQTTSKAAIKVSEKI